MEKTLWQIDSRYALVTCIDRNGAVIVEKVIAPKIEGVDVDWINNVSIYFRRKLQNLEVPLAEPYNCFKRNGKAVQESPYVGQNIEQLVKTTQPTISLIESLVDSMKGVLTQSCEEVGIDARLSNFCLDNQGRAIYVDTFPPLVKYNDEYIVHFPNPTEPTVIEQERNRKFTALGILRRLRFSILEQGAGFTEDDLLSAVGTVIGNDLKNSTENFFNTFLDHMEPNEAIDRINLDDPDGIRELGLRLLPEKGSGRTSYLNDLFELSSNFCPVNISEEERLARLRVMFLKRLTA